MPDTPNVLSLAARGEPVETLVAETNSDMIDELERILARVRDGQVAGVAISVVDINLSLSTYFNFHKGRASLVGGVSYLAYRMNEAFAKDA